MLSSHRSEDVSFGRRAQEADSLSHASDRLPSPDRIGLLLLETAASIQHRGRRQFCRHAAEFQAIRLTINHKERRTENGKETP
jgi:hypothetical protein